MSLHDQELHFVNDFHHCMPIVLLSADHGLSPVLVAVDMMDVQQNS